MTVGRGTSVLVRLASAVDTGGSLLEQARDVLRACPDASTLQWYDVTDPADLPAGAADRCLVAATVSLTGAPPEISARCAACGGRSTFVLAPESMGEHRWACRLTGPGTGVREPTYADLLAWANDPAGLLDACRVGATAGPAGEWADLEAVDESLSGPLRSSCAECGASLVVDADVVALAMSRLARACAGLDREVHLLASAYGWDLEAIEALPDHRRRRLVALVSGVPT